MLIQLILVALILLIIVSLLLQFRKKKINFWQFIGWLLIWLIAVIIIIWPDLTIILAGRVGVGRGVDLAIYVSIILIFFLLFKLLLRLEKTEKNLTELTRQLALKDESKTGKNDE